MIRALALIGILLIGAGCSSSRVVEVPPVEESVAAPSAVPIVTAPLPGVDSLVVAQVAESYDSTFVAAAAERQASEHYSVGHQVQIRLDSLLILQHGRGPLEGSGGSEADTTTLDRAMRTVSAAAQAQARQDSVQALALLDEAQRLYEAALQHNPFHEDARFQLSRVYRFLAQRYQLQHQWEATLRTLRGLLELNADQHVLWADMAVVLDTLQDYEASGLAWLQAATVVLDDARLAFTAEAPPPDSLTLFNYYQRAYSVFVKDRNGGGVRQSLAQAITYATDSTQYVYAVREQDWARWDGDHFEHRLAFDSLLTLAAAQPLDARNGLYALIRQLQTSPARLEANYNAAILTWQLEEYDSSLDSLQILWARTRAAERMPYEEFPAHLQETYGSMLFQRGMQHQQDGSSAIAFAYLLMVPKLESRYAGAAYIEALKLTRGNPRQARQLEPQIEEVFDVLTPEQQRTYLSLMGNLYRRIGETDKAQVFLTRYRSVPR
ncbi:MAG: hypothetical protein OXI38_02280 [Bacteroidota bacterium]|nr:hypothetical protein [Bacteroidota bacterium]